MRGQGKRILSASSAVVCLIRHSCQCQISDTGLSWVGAYFEVFDNETDICIKEMSDGTAYHAFKAARFAAYA